MQVAQSGIDKLAARMDGRRRTVEGVRTTVRALAESEVLLALPATPFPAQAEVARTVSAQVLLHFRGNQYSVPPGLGGARITVRSSDPLRHRRIKRHT
jgi:hypothetical protein